MIFLSVFLIIFAMAQAGNMYECKKGVDCGWCGYCVKLNSCCNSCVYPFKNIVSNEGSNCIQNKSHLCSSPNPCRHGVCISSIGSQAPQCNCNINDYFGELCQYEIPPHLKQRLAIGFAIFFSQISDLKGSNEDYTVYQIRIYVTIQYLGVSKLSIIASTSEGFEIILSRFENYCGTDLMLAPYKPSCPGLKCTHKLPNSCKGVYSAILDFPYNPTASVSLNLMGDYGNSVYGYLADVYVVANDLERTVYTNNFKVMVDFNNLAGTRQGPPPEIMIKGCASFSKHSTKYFRSMKIPFYFSITGSFFMLKFIVYLMPDLHIKKSYIMDKNAADSNHFWIISPYTLNAGKYKLRLLAKGTTVPSVSNFADCYFIIEKQPLVAILEGGAKIFVRKEDGIFISGVKSYDPNEPLTNQKHVSFDWTCKPNCDSIIQVSGRTMRVPPAKLTEGKTYTFTLTISADTLKPAVATQEISVVTNDIGVSLSIMCLANCKEKMLPIELLLLEIKTSISNPTGKFIWTYNMPEEDKVFHSVDGISDESYPSVKLCVKPNSLKPGKVYQFQATYQSTVKASYTVNVDSPPSNGSCKVSPSSGILGKTLFDIVCEGYIYHDPMVTFEYYNKFEYEPVETFNGRMLGSDRQGKLIGVALTREVVVIFIYSVNGCLAISSHKIHLKTKHFLFSEQALESNLTTIKTMAEKGLVGSALTDLTTILDVAVDNDTYNVFRSSIDIIKTGSIELKTLPQTKMGLLTFDKIVTLLPKSGGVKIDSSTMKDMTKYFKIISEALNNDVLGDGIPFFNRPLFNELAQLSINIIESIFAILNDFLSNVDKYSDIDSNEFGDLKKIANNIISTINYFTNSVSFMQIQGLHHLDLKSISNMSSLTVLTDSCLEAINRTNNNRKFNIKLPKDFIKCSLRNTDTITIQSTSFKAGPSLIPTFNSLATKIVSVEVFKRVQSSDGQSDQMELIKDDYKPFDLFMDAETTKDPGSISFSTALPNLQVVGSNCLDDFVTVVRIDIPQGCKMFVKFIFKNSSDQIRVKMQSQLRPTYQLMIDSSMIINSSYSTLNVPHEMIDEDEFMYIGVIPGPNTAPGRTVNCTITLYCNICLTRYEHTWVTTFCSVGGETTRSKIHCRCKHLSFFSAVFLIPPNQLNPFADIGLFLTIKDNPFVVLFVVSISALFLIFCALAIFRDRTQEEARGIIYLEDNFPHDQYFYIVAVFTGNLFWAGTDANVGLEIIGTTGRSRAHILKAKGKKVLRSGRDDWFFVATSTSLGTIRNIHIWHDNKGTIPDWYCEKIIVYDVNTLTVYTFFVEDWIALGNNEYPEAVLAPATADDFRSLTRIFVENVKHGIFHSYVLSGICSRYRDVEMTNLDRVLTLWCIVMTASLVGIAFYRVDHDNHDGIDDPHFSFGAKSVIKGIEMFLVNLFFIAFFQMIFKNSYRVEGEKDDTNYNFYMRKKGYSYVLEENQMFSVYLKPVERSNISAYEKFVRTIYKVYRPISRRPVVLSESSSPPVINKKPIIYIIALASSLLAIVLCSFFIILYGLKMGEVKSKNWMGRIVIAMFNHFLVLIPVKIILVAVILASHFVYLVPISNYKVKTDSITQYNRYNSFDCVVSKRREPIYHPLNTAETTKLKEKRARIVATYKTIVLIFLSCVIILFMNTESWNSSVFHASNNAKVMFQRNNEVDTKHFNDITNRTQYVRYLLKTFVDSDTFYRKRWYNTHDLSPSYLQDITSWAHDCTNQLVGLPVLRQLRVVANASCSINKLLQNIIDECIPMWSGNVQDTDSYGYGWSIKQWKFQSSTSPWVYETPSESEMSYSEGATGIVYPRGGYVAKLGKSRYKSNLILLHLRDGNWVDQNTQVVFGVLILYNVNVNVFTQLKFVAERSPTGFYLTNVQAESTVLTSYEILYTSVFIIYIFILIVKTCFEIYSKGARRYISKLVNLFKIFIVITGTVTAGLLIMDVYTKGDYVSYFQNNNAVNVFSFYKITKYQHMAHCVSIVFFSALIIKLYMFWPYGELYLNVLATIRRTSSMFIVVALCLVVVSSFHWNLLMFLNVDHFTYQDCGLRWIVTLNPRRCLRESFVNVILYLLDRITSAITLVLVLFLYTLEKNKSDFKRYS